MAADLSTLGAGTGAVWTRAAALALLTEGQVRAMLLHGYWQVLLPGIYADAGFVPTAEQRAHAAVLASGGSSGQPVLAKDRASWRAVAFGRTAARVWGFPLIDDDDPATGADEHRIDEVAVRTGRRTLVTGEREVRRTRPTLAPLDVTRLPSGLLVTSRVRTLFDCASLLTHEALVCAIDDGLHRGVVSPRQLASYAESHRWQPGAPAFRAALAAADGRSESPHETLVRLLLLPVLPGLRPQVELYDGGRLVARFDLADEEVRFAVEADGRAGHSGQAMVAKDRRRDRRTTKRGWETERVTWFEVRREQHETRERVVAAYAQRSRRAAA